MPGGEVLGRCSYCNVAEDTQSSDRVCAVCRDAVLVCSGCRVVRRGVYLCSDHESLDGPSFDQVLYHPHLEPVRAAVSQCYGR